MVIFMKTLTILVACGSGIATASLAEMRLREEFERRKIPLKTIKGKSFDIHSLIDQNKPDIIITTAVMTQEELHTTAPVFSGVPLLYGQGKAQFFKELFETVEKLTKE